jgi:hypothetical protein
MKIYLEIILGIAIFCGVVDSFSERGSKFVCKVIGVVLMALVEMKLIGVI